MPPHAAPLEPEQVRAPHPLQEADLGTLLARAKAAAQAERMQPLPPRAPGLPLRPPAEAAQPGGKVKPGSPAGYQPPTARTRLAPAAPGPSASTGGATAAAAPAAGPPAAAAPAARLKGLRCACCGLTTHPTDDCPLALVGGLVWQHERRSVGLRACSAA